MSVFYINVLEDEAFFYRIDKVLFEFHINLYWADTKLNSLCYPIQVISCHYTDRICIYLLF
jgi:hypothetical protein